MGRFDTTAHPGKLQNDLFKIIQPMLNCFFPGSQAQSLTSQPKETQICYLTEANMTYSTLNPPLLSESNTITSCSVDFLCFRPRSVQPYRSFFTVIREVALMCSLPKSSESKRLDKYSPLLYMVKIELTSAGCALCLPQGKTLFPIKTSQAIIPH